MTAVPSHDAVTAACQRIAGRFNITNLPRLRNTYYVLLTCIAYGLVLADWDGTGFETIYDGLNHPRYRLGTEEKGYLEFYRGRATTSQRSAAICVKIVVPQAAEHIGGTWGAWIASGDLVLVHENEPVASFTSPGEREILPDRLLIRLAAHIGRGLRSEATA